MLDKGTTKTGYFFTFLRQNAAMSLKIALRSSFFDGSDLTLYKV